MALGMTPSRCPQCGRLLAPGELIARHVETTAPIEDSDGGYPRVSKVVLGCSGLAATSPAA
jgi:hypothetical protein